MMRMSLILLGAALASGSVPAEVALAPTAVGGVSPPQPPATSQRTASITANEALRHYRELTSALPRCERDSAATDEIVVCAPGPKDHYRAWNGDPVPEPLSPREERLARRTARPDPLGPDTRCDGAQNTGRCGLADTLRNR